MLSSFPTTLMALPRILGRTAEYTSNKCSLKFQDSSGHVRFFDVQSAEAGAFVAPAVVDPATYEPGGLAEFAWIYFKGDPQTGPQPGHPFEMPFNNTSTEFSIDITPADDTSTTLRQVMPATNSSLFWRGGAPFGKPGNHSMEVSRLPSSCKYHTIGLMIYRWLVPEDLNDEVLLRLKLTTDEPPTIHFSGRLSISTTEIPSMPSSELASRPHAYLYYPITNFAWAGLAFILLCSWVIVCMRWRFKTIQLNDRGNENKLILP